MTDDSIPTKERILVEASKLFAQQGYHRTSTREIAEKVGIRQPSLFYHYPSKTEIMRPLLDAAIDGALAAIRRQLAASGSPAKRFHAYVVEDLVAVCESPYDLGGTTTQAVLADPEFADAAERYRTLFDARVELIQEGIDAGEFGPVNAQFAGRAIEWLIEGLSTEVGCGLPQDFESLAGQVADFCVRALLVPSPAVPAVP